MTKTHLFLILSAGLAVAGGVRADADDGGSASAATSTSASAMAASGTAATADSPTAAAAATPVAKNDAPGSLKEGKKLLDEGKDADAVAYFQGIGEQVADHGQSKREPYRQLDLATAYLQLGQYSKAEDAASKAVALKKDLEPAWNDLAAAQVNEGHRDQAIATYTKAIAQLKSEQVDTTNLEANLKVLQDAEAKYEARHKPKQGKVAAAAADVTAAAESAAADVTSVAESAAAAVTNAAASAMSSSTTAGN